jgi:hypothetical protein
MRARCEWRRAHQGDAANSTIKHGGFRFLQSPNFHPAIEQHERLMFIAIAIHHLDQVFVVQGALGADGDARMPRSRPVTVERQCESSRRDDLRRFERHLAIKSRSA